MMDFLYWCVIYFVIPFLIFPIWVYVVVYIASKAWTLGKIKGMEDCMENSLKNAFQKGDLKEKKE